MNTNLMDVDPLRSYGQYNAYHPPYPHTQPDIHHPQPNIPHSQPSVIQSQPNPRSSQPNIPNLQSIPELLPIIPNAHTSTPRPQPNIPISQPSIPVQPSYYPLPYNQNMSDSQNGHTNPGHSQDHSRNYIAQSNSAHNQQGNIPETGDDEELDIKPDISKIILKKPKKPKGKTSSYWNKKVTDKDFKFYGCSICNIAYNKLTDLDAHVVIHSNRVTSYDIRLQNLKKRKRLKKEKKKKKKKGNKLKVEDIEIKPEDGYIGSEKAGDLNQPDVKENNGVKMNEDVKENKLEDKSNENKIEENKKNEVYKCFACNKQFALSYYLKIHVRSHTDEKPYICNYCGQTFITASKLGRHNKRIHLAVRHQCRICYAFFSRFELLTKHFDKKHADQKLEGEPYDYNAILPYLNELEDQFKLESESKDTKPKTEDIWGDWPQDLNIEVPKAEDSKAIEKKESTTPKPEIALDAEELKMEGVEVKCEQEELEVLDVAFEDGVVTATFEPDSSSDNEPDAVKEERLPTTDDEEEYFPPTGWAGSAPVDDGPPPSPPPRKQGGKGECNICHRKFSSTSYLKIHMRTHTGERPFSCYVCGRGFITASKMHRHVLTHDETWVGEDRIKTEGEIVKSEAEDDVDKDKQRKKNKARIAKAKDKLLKKPNKRMDPELKKGRGRPHNCEYCGKKFLHFETLQVHMKSHDGEDLVLKCNFCLEPQLDQVAKGEHELTHSGPKPYICTLCGRKYKDKGAMVYHRKNHKPTDTKMFICDICSKRFNAQAKLSRHILTHTSEKFVLRYECPVCANMFHTRWHVQMHLKSHQKEGLILEENRNAVLAMVLQNARKIPKGGGSGPDAAASSAEPPGPPRAPTPPSADEQSRICNICGQVFQHFYYLEEHLKTHGSKIAVEDLDKEEEKKYTCQVCSKSFKLHYYLKLHSFTHTKEKPFICQQCGKGFITRGKLKRHLETHQGLKKYQCHICYKFFTRPSYMRIHVRTIHGTQDYNFSAYGVGVPLGLGVPMGQMDDM